MEDELLNALKNLKKDAKQKLGRNNETKMDRNDKDRKRFRDDINDDEIGYNPSKKHKPNPIKNKSTLLKGKHSNKDKYKGKEISDHVWKGKVTFKTLESILDNNDITKEDMDNPYQKIHIKKIHLKLSNEFKKKYLQFYNNTQLFQLFGLVLKNGKWYTCVKNEDRFMFIVYHHIGIQMDMDKSFVEDIYWDKQDIYDTYIKMIRHLQLNQQLLNTINHEMNDLNEYKYKIPKNIRENVYNISLNNKNIVNYIQNAKWKAMNKKRNNFNVYYNNNNNEIYCFKITKSGKNNGSKLLKIVSFWVVYGNYDDI